MKRILYDIAVLLSIFLLPWWITLSLLVIGIFLFTHYYESIVAMMLMQGMYGSEASRLIASPLILSLIVTITFVLLLAIKNKIIFVRHV